MKGAYTLLIGLLFAGCSAVLEVGQSQLEVPTLEAQLNRVAVGLGIVRENTMLMAMPISADAQWPTAIGSDVSPQERRLIRQALQRDPYYATHRYTDLVQMKMLGGYMIPPTSALTERAFKRIVVLYGDAVENWPTFFSFDGGVGALTQFHDGTPKPVEAVTGNLYPGLDAAVTALLPANYRKEIETALEEQETARRRLAEFKQEKGMLESREQLENETMTYGVYEQMNVLNVQIERAEEVVSEKEMIVARLLELAEDALQSDLRLNAEQVALAENILHVCDAVETGAIEAGTLFSIAMGNITLRDMLRRFPTEMESLAIGTAAVPGHLQGLYAKRLVRLAENAVYLLPAITVGSYEAISQVTDASRYARIAAIVVDAERLRRQQNETKE